MGQITDVILGGTQMNLREAFHPKRELKDEQEMVGQV